MDLSELQFEICYLQASSNNINAPSLLKSRSPNRRTYTTYLYDVQHMNLISALQEGLLEESTPEIIRCPLEKLVLLAKMLDMGSPSDVLALAMDPPDLTNIQRTVLVLKEVRIEFILQNIPV